MGLADGQFGCKRSIRRQIESHRRAQPDKELRSQRIIERLLGTESFKSAASVLIYVSARSEVRTHDLLSIALQSGKNVVVPYCLPDRLELFRLERMDELTPGTWGILEPAPELRALPDREFNVRNVNFFCLPGVAFTRDGGRLGYGKAYFDRLLRHAAPDAVLAGLAFECQFVAEMPMEPHDVWLDLVITEADVYAGPGRHGGLREHPPAQNR
jgi:5-formyltetrahydrofolate cyclo-ligase